MQTQLWEQDGDPGTPVDQTAYSPRDADGNVTGEAESVAEIDSSSPLVTAYTYDSMNRVTGYNRTGDGQSPASATYSYDSLGNNTDPFDGRHVQRQ